MATTSTGSSEKRFFQEFPFHVERKILDYPYFHDSGLKEVTSEVQYIGGIYRWVLFMMKTRVNNKVEVGIRMTNLMTKPVSDIILINGMCTVINHINNGWKRYKHDGAVLLTHDQPTATICKFDASNPTHTDIAPNLVQPGSVTIKFDGSFLIESTRPQSLVKCMKNLLEDKSNCDVTLIVGNTQFPAHRAVLAARSSVFKAMMHSDMAESRDNSATIEDTEPEIFEVFLRFLYIGDIPAPKEMAADLLLLADRFNVDHLKTTCLYEMMRYITVDCCLNNYIKADTISATDVCYKTARFIRKHYSTVKRTQKWKDLALSEPDLILRLRDTIDDLPEIEPEL